LVFLARPAKTKSSVRRRLVEASQYRIGGKILFSKIHWRNATIPLRDELLFKKTPRMFCNTCAAFFYLTLLFLCAIFVLRLLI